MSHFSILSTLLQHAQRKYSATRICKVSQISRRQFQKAKHQFKLPTEQIIARSHSKPVRLVIDYVLISRTGKTLTFPFNLLYNHHSKQFGPTLCLLFAVAELDGKYYPIDFEFWTQKEWDEMNFFSRNELAKYMITSLYERGLVIKELLCDAGFCSTEFLDEMGEMQIPYVCRIRSDWGIESYGAKRKARQMFGLGKKFFFDRHKGCYVFSRKGRFGEHKVKMVAIANNRQRLESKQFYCLLTNQIKLSDSMVLRHYLKRGKIEWFFKMMKSYLGLGAFFRHHPDDALTPHIEMRCAGFVLAQELAGSWKMSVESTLHKLNGLSTLEVRYSLKDIFDRWAESLVDSTRTNSCSSETQAVAG